MILKEIKLTEEVWDFQKIRVIIETLIRGSVYFIKPVISRRLSLQKNNTSIKMIKSKKKWLIEFGTSYPVTFPLVTLTNSDSFCNRDRTIWFQLLLGSGVFCFPLSYPSFCFSVLSPAFPRRCWNILCNSSHPDPLTICTFPAKQQKNRKEIQNQKYKGSVSNFWQKSRWCGTGQTNDVIGLLWYEVKIF